MKKLRTIIVLLVFSTSHFIIAAHTHELNTYFTRLKRGVSCIIKNKKCSDEDRKAVLQAGGIIVALLTPIIITTFYTRRKKSQQSKPKTKQEKLDEKLIIAARDANAEQVEQLLHRGANPNARLGGQYDHVLYLTLHHLLPGHPASNQQNAIKIVKLLVQKGADQTQHTGDDYGEGTLSIPSTQSIKTWINRLKKEKNIELPKEVKAVLTP